MSRDFEIEPRRQGGGRKISEPALPDVWQGDAPPDVWDGEPLQLPDSTRDSEKYSGDGNPVDTGGLAELYGDVQSRSRPSKAQVAPHLRLPQSKATDSPDRGAGLIGSVLIPAATIAMVASLLFFLYDIRSVYLPGSPHLKWIGFCFVLATVLIARYGRTGTGGLSSTVYSIGLALATMLAMGLSPWEAPAAGILGPLSNGLIIAMTWRFATGLTVALSSDLEIEVSDEPRLYGLERLEMQGLRRQREQGPASVYELGRRASKEPRSSRPAANPEQAFRTVIRLIVVGLIVFAVGEPALLAGHPAAAERALGAMIIFLFSASWVLAASSSYRNLERLKALGGKAGLAGISSRLLVASSLMVLLLSVALVAPGLHFKGRGEIVALSLRDGQASEGAENQGAGTGSPNSEGSPGSNESSRSKGASRSNESSGSKGASESENDSKSKKGSRVSTTDGERTNARNESARGKSGEASAKGSRGTGTASASSVVNLLASLGEKLRFPVLIAAAFLGLYSLWRWLPGLIRALASLGLQGLWASAWGALLRRLSFRLPTLAARRTIHGADPDRPLENLDELACVEPQLAVLAAYGRMCRAWAVAGYEPPEHQTPTENLSTLPAGLRTTREPCNRLTEIYLRSAFSGQPTSITDRERAIRSLSEMRRQMTLEENEGRV